MSSCRHDLLTHGRSSALQVVAVIIMLLSLCFGAGVAYSMYLNLKFTYGVSGSLKGFLPYFGYALLLKAGLDVLKWLGLACNLAPTVHRGYTSPAKIDLYFR
jgi:hypothetical protein